MKKVVDECVNCTHIGFPCLGNRCPNKNVVRFYCDRCGDEDKLYDYYGEELCAECLLEEFNVIEGSEY